MARVSVWVLIVLVVLGLGAVWEGAAGITFQWACDDYAAKKAAAIESQGYTPPDEYSFIGLGIGFCSVGYSDE